MKNIALLCALGIVFIAIGLGIAVNIPDAFGEDKPQELIEPIAVEDDADELAKAQKELKRYKAEKIKTINKYIDKYDDVLSARQRKQLRECVDNIKKSSTIKSAEKQFSKAKNIYSKSKKDYKYVSYWTDRIDRYLKGSKTSGCGKYYALAAWKYGVDPKWAPAISCVESGKGSAYIPGTYNIWGWGCGSIKLGDSWKEAIDRYVSKLKDGYGSKLTMSAATKYCGSYWYYLVSNEMSNI